MKMKYDESDNALIRASRAVTDKMTDLIGDVPTSRPLVFTYERASSKFYCRPALIKWSPSLIGSSNALDLSKVPFYDTFWFISECRRQKNNSDFRTCLFLCAFKEKRSTKDSINLHKYCMSYNIRYKCINIILNDLTHSQYQSSHVQPLFVF